MFTAASFIFNWLHMYWSLIIKLLHLYVSSSKQYCLKWNLVLLLSRNGNLSSWTDFKMFFAVFFLVFCNSQCRRKHIYHVFFSHVSSPILFACLFCLFLYIIKLRFIMYFSLPESLSFTHRWLISQHRLSYRSNITLWRILM